VSGYVGGATFPVVDDEGGGCVAAVAFASFVPPPLHALATSASAPNAATADTTGAERRRRPESFPNGIATSELP
jgi:hypothetical protein